MKLIMKEVLIATFHLALGHWLWPRHMLARIRLFLRCRALKSRASSEELKAQKLSNLPP